MADRGSKEPSTQESYVLVERHYADIAHLENPSVIERILSRSRREVTEYIGQLLQSGVSRYALAGPKVAIKAMAIEALTDLWKEVSAWRKAGRIPEDFSGRPAGYQTWVELLQEIDSNPVDIERLRAMKAMFLAANKINATDGEAVVAYQFFQISKRLTSGELLLLRAIYDLHKAGGLPKDFQISNARNWRSLMASKLGHQMSALVQQNERALAEVGLITPILMSGQLETIIPDNARLSDLGLRFCENIESYQIEERASQK